MHFHSCYFLLFLHISSYDVKYFSRYEKEKHTVAAHFVAVEQPRLRQPENHHNHSTFWLSIFLKQYSDKTDQKKKRM